MSAYPNSDLNPILAAGNSKVSVISSGELPPLYLIEKNKGFPEEPLLFRLKKTFLKSD